MQDYKKWLVERFIIERKRFDRSGVYAYTQRARHIIPIKLKEAHLLQNRQPLFLTVEHYLKVMTITEPKMLKKRMDIFLCLITCLIPLMKS